LATTIVLRDFARDYPGEPVPEETLTHPRVSVGPACAMPAWPYWKFLGHELQSATGRSASRDHESGTLHLLLFLTISSLSFRKILRAFLFVWSHHPDHPIFINFCTKSLHVLFDLSLGLEPSTSYSIHYFTQSVGS